MHCPIVSIIAGIVEIYFATSALRVELLLLLMRMLLLLEFAIDAWYVLAVNLALFFLHNVSEYSSALG